MVDHIRIKSLGLGSGIMSTSSGALRQGLLLLSGQGHINPWGNFLKGALLAAATSGNRALSLEEKGTFSLGEKEFPLPLSPTRPSFHAKLHGSTLSFLLGQHWCQTWSIRVFMMGREPHQVTPCSNSLPGRGLTNHRFHQRTPVLISSSAAHPLPGTSIHPFSWDASSELLAVAFK